jgi:hypothetical protein
MLFIGADIGQSVDPTAVIVIDTDLASKLHTVRWVETLPLGTSYPDVVDRLVEIDNRCRSEGAAQMIVDNTGVGRPVVDLLRTRLSGGLHAVTIGAGTVVSQPGPHESVVPKRDITGVLELVLQTRRLIVTKGLQGAGDLKAELKAFNFAISRGGRDSYEASAGSHDDLVIALGLALWSAERWLARGGRRGARMKYYGPPSWQTRSAPSPNSWGTARVSW